MLSPTQPTFHGATGQNRTGMACSSDRCNDQLCYSGVAGVVRFELTVAGLESAGLPLTDTPMEPNSRVELQKAHYKCAGCPSSSIRLAQRTGFEPVVSCVTGRRLHLSTNAAGGRCRSRTYSGVTQPVFETGALPFCQSSITPRAKPQGL